MGQSAYKDMQIPEEDRYYLKQIILKKMLEEQSLPIVR